jgi:hypothetical protein
MPRFLNDLDIFYDPSLQSGFNPGFDESTPPAIPLSKTTLILSSSIVSGSIVPTYSLATGSTDTSAIDAYTQGVELTQLKRHDAGFAKVWSGEAGHQMLVTWYGEQGPATSNPFADNETAYFNFPSSVVENSPVFPTLLFPIQPLRAGPRAPQNSLAYKIGSSVKTTDGVIKYRTQQDIGYTILNGTIEPLAIRLQPSFYNSDVPSNPHAFVGEAGSGNVDELGGSDQIKTVDYYNTGLHQPPFSDDGQNITLYSFVFKSNGGIKFIASRNIIEVLTSPSTAGVVSGSSVGAFVHDRYVRNSVSSSSEDSSLRAALSLMTGSTDNYVSFDQRSATCGWLYDNAVVTGTDSLSFGGMTY